MKAQSGRIVATLEQQVAAGAEATQIADAVVVMWREIEAALGPIIGTGSVAVLYLRSLHLVDPAHPWLRTMDHGAHTAVDLAALKAILAAQGSDTAAAAGGALLQTFYELLASLVGQSLTERLLNSVWEPSLSGPPAQDTSS